MPQPTHFPSQVVVKLLLDLGHGKMASDPTKTPEDWWLSAKSMPDKGDLFITAFDTETKDDFREMRTGEHAEFYGVQLLLRGPDDLVVEAKGKQLTDYFDLELTCRTVVLDSRQYRLSNFSRRGRLAFVKEEERTRRRVYSLNGYVTLWEV